MNMNMNNSMIYGNDTNVMIADRIISHCIASHSIMNCCLLQLVSSLAFPTFVVFIVFYSVLLEQAARRPTAARLALHQMASAAQD